MSSNLASSDSTSSADALLCLVNILFGKLSKCDSESILATMLQVINSQALEGKAKDSQILRLEQAIKVPLTLLHPRPLLTGTLRSWKLRPKTLRQRHFSLRVPTILKTSLRFLIRIGLN